MTLNDLAQFERLFEEKMKVLCALGDDPAHDMLHLHRVVKTAKKLCLEEDAKVEVVIPAAWLHDFVIVAKNDPRRSQASRLSAEAAIQFLNEIDYPSEYYNEIAHAIATHSFSANLTCETREAEIVQDADRLDGLGAIGIARCFATAGLLKRAFYSEEDPFCHRRAPEDKAFTVDHFFAKLFRVAETLKTKAGQAEGRQRVLTMKSYLNHFEREIGSAD
jgi:uncharacterized protein